MTAIEKLIQTAENEIGYAEKNSNKDLNSKTANKGPNNYTKYNRDYRAWTKTGAINQQWCAAFVSWVFVQSFGLDMARKLLGGKLYKQCQTGADNFKSAGRYVDRKKGEMPKIGDVVFFWRSKKGRLGHTGIVYKLDENNKTKFYTIEGNASNKVKIRDYDLSKSSDYNEVRGFGRPNYSLLSDWYDMDDYEDDFEEEIPDIWTEYQVRTDLLKEHVINKDRAEYQFYHRKNPLSQAGFQMPNCVTYSWGRFWEISKDFGEAIQKPTLSTANAENWFFKLNDGYKRSPLYLHNTDVLIHTYETDGDTTTIVSTTSQNLSFNNSTIQDVNYDGGWYSLLDETDWRKTKWIAEGLPCTSNIQECVPKIGAVAVWAQGRAGYGPRQGDSGGGQVAIVEAIARDAETGEVTEIVVSQSSNSGSYWSLEHLLPEDNYTWDNRYQFLGFIYNPNNDITEVEKFYVDTPSCAIAVPQIAEYDKNSVSINSYRRQYSTKTEITIRVSDEENESEDGDNSTLDVGESIKGLLSFNYQIGFNSDDNSIVDYTELEPRLIVRVGSATILTTDLIEELNSDDNIITLPKIHSILRDDLRISRDKNNVYLELLSDSKKVTLQPNGNGYALPLSFTVEYNEQEAIKNDEEESITPDDSTIDEEESIAPDDSSIDFSIEISDLYFTIEQPSYDSYSQFLNSLTSTENTDRGIYIRNGEMFINASVIATGTIMSQNWIASGGRLNSCGGIEKGGTEGTAFDLINGEINTTNLKVTGEQSYTLSLTKDNGLMLTPPEGENLMQMNDTAMFIQSPNYYKKNQDSSSVAKKYREGTVKTSSGLVIRAEPGTGKKKIGSVPSGTKTVKIYTEEDGTPISKKANGYTWYNISYSGIIGWSASKWITYKSDSVIQEEKISESDSSSTNTNAMKIDIMDHVITIINDKGYKLVIGDQDHAIKMVKGDSITKVIANWPTD